MKQKLPLTRKQIKGLVKRRELPFQGPVPIRVSKHAKAKQPKADK